MIKIITDHKWKNFVSGSDVPKKVLKKDFDWWLLEEGDYGLCFFKFKKTWHNIAEFEKTKIFASSDSTSRIETEIVNAGWPLANFSWQTADSESGLLLKISEDNLMQKQYMIATYFVMVSS